MKSSLFHEWIHSYKGMNQVVPTRDWFVFLQTVLKGLKSQDHQEVIRFLAERLPRLFEAGASMAYTLEALEDLRLRLVKHILQDQTIAQENKNLFLTNLSQMFQGVINLFCEWIGESSQAPAAPGQRSSFPRIKDLPGLAMILEGERFAATRASYSPGMYSLLTVEAGQPADWETILHPQDYLECRFTIKSAQDARQPFYELTYRIKAPNGNWKEMCEIGRIFYTAEGAPVRTAAVIFPLPDQAGGAGEISPATIFSSLIDEEREFLFVTELSGRVSYISPALLKTASPAGESRQRPDSGRTTIFELFNKALGRKLNHYWQQLESQPDQLPALRLELPAREAAPQPREWVFRPAALHHSFAPEQLVFYGQPPERSDQPDRLVQQLRRFSRLNFEDSTSLENFYQSLLNLAGQLFPQARAIGILVKRQENFRYFAGSGYENSQCQDAPVLNTGHLRNLQTLQSDDQNDDEFETLVKLEIEKGLDRYLASGLESLDNAPDHRGHLLGLVYRKSEPQAIVSVRFGADHLAEASSQQILLSLFCQRASHVLDYLGAKFAFRQHLLALQRSILEIQVPVAILKDGLIEQANSRFLSLVNAEADEVTGKSWQAWVEEADREPLQACLARFEEADNGQECQVNLEKKDGQTVAVKILLSRLPFTEGEEFLLMVLPHPDGAGRDERLLKAQRLETLGSLTTSVVHNFNNYLGAIIPSAQLIIKNPNAKDVEKRAKLIFVMAQRAASLIRQLLSYAHSAPEKVEEVNLNGLLLEIQDMFQRIVGPSIQINYRLTSDLPLVKGDHDQYLQMLLNLVLNARDALTDGGEIDISTRFRRVDRKQIGAHTLEPGDYVELSVHDNGKGIPPGIRKRIFDPFFTTKPEGVATGLGLSIVYGILKRHEGYVIFHSEPGQGTTFHIYLPACEAPAKAPKTKPATQQKPISGQGTFLVVDDEKYLREVLSSMGKLLGYGSFEAANGKDAVQIYQERQNQIDLVILDYAMPGINGKQTYLALKKLNPTIPVILCTGYGDQKDVTELMKEPNVEFLPKPFTIEMLGQKVARLLAQTGKAN